MPRGLPRRRSKCRERIGGCPDRACQPIGLVSETTGQHINDCSTSLILALNHDQCRWLPLLRPSRPKGPQEFRFYYTSSRHPPRATPLLAEGCGQTHDELELEPTVWLYEGKAIVEEDPAGPLLSGLNPHHSWPQQREDQALTPSRRTTRRETRRRTRTSSQAFVMTFALWYSTNYRTYPGPTHLSISSTSQFTSPVSTTHGPTISVEESKHQHCPFMTVFVSPFYISRVVDHVTRGL
ncbi:hypothetical protein GALMADRAFT_148960 [Galerina marginata CBS 339.88]|uniref:Uncharacterized protein n=1 Tax=Galerina marginata (strain CBS 339.88) TaxID=685588 RepID=A0A067SEE2_GALM3|nr:hypothetical protein GALMADRAFT_148960 [Galerina marginata CBS 339.88]